MSSSKSWFSSPNSNRSPLLSKTSHDLPRWRSPSPMSSSMIPPPIVQSTYVAPRETLAQSVFVEKPSLFDERQHEIQADLQYLLDAQAEGLVRGFEGGSLEDRSSTGSTTPTAQSVRSASARRVGKPTRRRPGVKSARKGIYNSIQALSALKDEEVVEIQSQIQDDDVALGKINGWEKKREKLHNASQHAESEEDAIRVSRLKQEADNLQDEINRVELHLQEMKSKQRKLLRQAAAVENSVQAKLASYTSSLRSLEDDVQKYLSIVPSDSRSSTSGVERSVWQLPPKQRNLQLAKDYWNEQRRSKQQQLEAVQHEKTALMDGAALWIEATMEINEYERWFRSEMAASMSHSQSAWEDPVPPEVASSSTRQLLDRLLTTLTSLEKKYHLAEERNWRLLIAALGAELDAMRRARQILEDMLGPSSRNMESRDAHTDGVDGFGAADEILELDKSFQTIRQGGRGTEISDTEDEPSPELMFSRQDT